MEDTEQRILDAALRVFASEGYTGATTRKIAEEANVAEVTLFRKFKSKENLLKEVLISNRTVFSSLEELFHIFQNEKDADLETELRILGKNIAKAMKDKKKDSKRRMFMFMLFEEGRRRPEVSEALLSFLQLNIKPLSEYFDLQIKNGKMRTINSRSAAITFVSYFVYTSLLREVFGDSLLGDYNEEIERFIDIFTKGILKDEEN
ncbi:TetR family transcriptional regulator [Methanosarcina sp. DH1]|uniref:TetR/AcrR family transcriptional regulator n=1 Tax=Methanosarcina sp. DH1 TaxID=2605695 RepID=UPI001E492ECB|nr:TetR/AcrR family transcriptional regulator [Methanosarcina sp. DH1]MCC4767282.1 TetR family transcriptional regulator [Methanosarcina sp. DH1]